MSSKWDSMTRNFLLADDTFEHDKLMKLENGVNTKANVFLSKEHQRAIALDYGEISANTRLTKGDADPPAIYSDGMSDITGKNT